MIIFLANDDGVKAWGVSSLPLSNIFFVSSRADDYPSLGSTHTTRRLSSDHAASASSSSAAAPPHVTISSEGGSVVRYRFPEANIEELASSASASTATVSSSAASSGRDQGAASRYIDRYPELSPFDV